MKTTLTIPTCSIHTNIFKLDCGGTLWIHQQQLNRNRSYTWTIIMDMYSPWIISTNRVVCMTKSLISGIHQNQLSARIPLFLFTLIWTKLWGFNIGEIIVITCLLPHCGITDTCYVFECCTFFEPPLYSSCLCSVFFTYVHNIPRKNKTISIPLETSSHHSAKRFTWYGLRTNYMYCHKTL